MPTRAAFRPQTSQKFNLPPPVTICLPNAPFTACSPQKTEHRLHARVVAATVGAGNPFASRSIDTGSQANSKEVRMTRISKTLTAIAAAATLSAAALVPTQPAQARGGAVAAGIIGGLAAGAIIGSAAAHGPYYGPGYYYGPGPVYYGPHCWWHRERVWDGWGWRVHRVRVCD